jgi:NAD-dependent deacetylase
VDEVREWLRSARSVVALTGAGISAESGVPTFRGAGGLWKQYRPEQLATPEAFAQDPVLVWEWYLWRRGLIAKAEPNPGHNALAAFEGRTPAFTLVTQNVDGLHERAGNRNIVKLHGDIWRSRCLTCGEEHADDRTELDRLPPVCACGGMLRPAVVWFGEGLRDGVWNAAERAVRSADAVLVIGTSAVVYPAAMLVPLAKKSGAKVIEVNTDETPMSTLVDASLRGASGRILPELLS